MRLHVSEGVGWRMDERKMGVVEDLNELNTQTQNTQHVAHTGENKDQINKSQKQVCLFR